MAVERSNRTQPFEDWRGSELSERDYTDIRERVARLCAESPGE